MRSLHARCWSGVMLGALGLLLWTACGTIDGTLHVPPSVLGAVFVGNAACAECHAE
ncbi:MAG: hypothetical protein KJ072_05965 [Verrucomicrobia bacterium]|nr:hypothetical protein [Verrucomicrobiota bacterium]